MISVYAHTDYRAFLRGWFSEEKERRPVISYRWMGQKLLMDASLLAKILGGERHLSASRVQPVIDMVGLAGLEAEYFRVLVQYGKSKSAKETQVCFAKLAELRRVAPVPVEESQASFWDSWLHVAIRALVACGDFGDEWERIGSLLHPRQNAPKVREAVGTLAALGFVEKRDDGFWRVREPFLRDGKGPQTRALRHFHRQSLLLAVEAIEGLPATMRHVSSVTVSIPESGYAEIAEMVDDFRSRIMTAVSRMKSADRVYQVSLQVVPLAFPAPRDPGQEG
jgi:uncharacterized protein (TIGR02147 family)